MLTSIQIKKTKRRMMMIWTTTIVWEQGLQAARAMIHLRLVMIVQSAELSRPHCYIRITIRSLQVVTSIVLEAFWAFLALLV